MRLFLTFLLVFSISSVATAQENSTDFRKLVDPRIELMGVGVIQLLTDYPLVSEYESLYKRDVRAYFADFKNHDAAKLFEEMDGNRFAFDAVPKVMLSLTLPPDLNPKKLFTKSLERRASGPDSLAKFVEALRDFAQTSKFLHFINRIQVPIQQYWRGQRMLTQQLRL